VDAFLNELREHGKYTVLVEAVVVMAINKMRVEDIWYGTPVFNIPAPASAPAEHSTPAPQ
jgi:hypothetical protein